MFFFLILAILFILSNSASFLFATNIKTKFSNINLVFRKSNG